MTELLCTLCGKVPHGPCSGGVMHVMADPDMPDGEAEMRSGDSVVRLINIGLDIDDYRKRAHDHRWDGNKKTWSCETDMNRALNELDGLRSIVVAFQERIKLDETELQRREESRQRIMSEQRQFLDSWERQGEEWKTYRLELETERNQLRQKIATFIGEENEGKHNRQPTEAEVEIVAKKLAEIMPPPRKTDLPAWRYQTHRVYIIWPIIRGLLLSTP